MKFKNSITFPFVVPSRGLKTITPTLSFFQEVKKNCTIIFKRIWAYESSIQFSACFIVNELGEITKSKRSIGYD